MPSPSVSEIRESIEARIVELRSEMTSLESARGALRADAAPATAPAAVTVAAPVAAVEPPPTPASATGPPPTRRANSSGKRRKPTEVLLAGKLETMLRETPDGLSVAAITRRSDARAGQVRDLLRELENAGQVRRTGTGRGSRWRFVSDEERIAERAAELAKLSRATP